MINIKKNSLFLIVVSFLNLVVISSPALSFEDQVSHNRTKIFFGRSFIVALTAAQALLINSQMEFLGISDPGKHASMQNYLVHNLANAFPTVAKLFGASNEQYNNAGPMVHAFNIPAVSIVLCMGIQNGFLCRYFKLSEKEPLTTKIVEPIVLTTMGYVTAWAMGLLAGAIL